MNRRSRWTRRKATGLLLSIAGWFLLATSLLPLLLSLPPMCAVVYMARSDGQANIVIGVAAFVLVAAGLTCVRAGDQMREQKAGCRQCGYDVRNLTSDRCPECGAVL